LEGHSEYKRWYFVDGGYEALLNVKRMPKLNAKYTGKWIKGVSIHWLMNGGVNGFRIDVAAGLPPWLNDSSITYGDGPLKSS